jgi:adenylate cyclase
MGRGGSVMVLFCLLMGLMIESIKQIDRKFGPGNLKRMLLGKYYQPKEEERIFMFLDMRSSTTIAEKLGHIKYSQLIQDCFKDINAVVPFQAEVYQYVGDEVVLTWELEKGLKNANCIHAYFAFIERLSERKNYYLEKYNLLPEFKAGANFGMVTAAEVGEIKRVIAYLGDVLNTAARIQSKCNEFGRDFLISKKLMDALPDNSPFIFEKIGELELRGKKEMVGVFGVKK